MLAHSLIIIKSLTSAVAVRYVSELLVDSGCHFIILLIDSTNFCPDISHWQLIH